MCLVTRQIKPKTMKKDLIVWKSVKLDWSDRNKAYSRYYEFEWTRGVIYEKDLVKTRSTWKEAEKYDYVVWVAYPDQTGKFTSVSEGFHACKQERRGGAWDRFLIPKGALYFEDESGLIVANKMMYI